MNTKEFIICASLLTAPNIGQNIYSQKIYTWNELGKIFELKENPNEMSNDKKWDTYVLQEPIQNDIEITNDAISKSFAKSMIKYFRDEVNAYSFSAQEEAALQKDIESYFDIHKIFQIEWNKVTLHITEQDINDIFKHFMPHFENKLSWIQKFWLHLLWEKAVRNIIKRHCFTKAKWKDAETAYQDIMVILKYATEWFRSLNKNADMTIWYWYKTITNVLPNEHIKSKMDTRSSNYKNKSIRYIKTTTPY